jgi:hypothetical protein
VIVLSRHIDRLDFTTPEQIKAIAVHYFAPSGMFSISPKINNKDKHLNFGDTSHTSTQKTVFDDKPLQGRATLCTNPC